MISIVIPFKEDRGYLLEALESVWNQTYKDYEILIQYSANSSGYNMNQGIKRAKGKYIIYLCEDDLLTTESLQDRFDFMEANDFDIIHSRGFHLYPDGRTKPYGMTNPYTQFNSCLVSNGIMGGSTMYRAEMLKKEGWDDIWTACEWSTHLKLLHKGYKLGFLDKFTYLYRRHSGQKSIGNMSNEYQAKREKTKEEIRCQYTKQH